MSLVKHTNKKGYNVEIDERLLSESEGNPLYKEFIDELRITDEGFIAIPINDKWDEVLLEFYSSVFFDKQVVK